MNYSSIRAGMLEFRRRCGWCSTACWCISCAARWGRVMKQAMLAGALDAPGFARGGPARRRQYLQVKWIPQGWQWVDPRRNSMAMLLAIRAGLMSRSEAISALATTPDVDREIAADNQRADDLGLILDSDPRYTAKDGGSAEPNRHAVAPTPPARRQPDRFPPRIPMTVLPHLAARLFNVPLAIHRPKLDVILSVLGLYRLADLAAPVGYTPAAARAGAGPRKVAVIPIHGTLVRRTRASKPNRVSPATPASLAQLDAALATPRSLPSCSTSIRRVASRRGRSGRPHPRGVAAKPVWAVANDMAFSAAYALASAATGVRRAHRRRRFDWRHRHARRSVRQGRQETAFATPPCSRASARTTSTRTSRSPTRPTPSSRPRWIASMTCSSRRSRAIAASTRTPFARHRSRSVLRLERRRRRSGRCRRRFRRRRSQLTRNRFPRSLTQVAPGQPSGLFLQPPDGVFHE